MKWSYLKLFKHLYHILIYYPLFWRKMAEYSELDGGQAVKRRHPRRHQEQHIWQWLFYSINLA